jgi:N-acetylmuramoyl-L-alanine amidase
LIAGIDLPHESSDVTNILIDLAQRETMNGSAVFAGNIVDELGRETALLTNTHRFAGFAVLKSPDVPAVLIEMGYLSNASDEHNLRQPEYRAKLARAITHAVEHYFLQGQKARRL